MQGDQAAAKGEVVAVIAIREEAVVADAVEAVRQGMEKKAADELAGVERHRFDHAVLAIVKRTLPFSSEQPAVGDGDAMGIR